MATAPTTTSDISGWMGSWTLRYDSNQDSTSGTTSSVWYEAIHSSGDTSYTTYGMEIRCDTNNSKNYIYIDSGGNTSHPNQVSVAPSSGGTHGALASFVEVAVGNEVKFYKSVAEGSTLQQTWIVDSGRLFTFSSGSSGSTFATLTSTSSVPATGTQTHSYVADSVRNIQIEKTAAYQFTVSWQHADIHSMGQVIYYVRKNADQVSEIASTFSAVDGSYSMVITSSTVYPNAKFDTGDVITLHASDAVATENPDGSFSMRSAGSTLATFTYNAIDVQATLSTGRIGDTLNVSVFDRLLYPDYQNFVTFTYLPYNPPSTYTGGSTSNLTSVITGINSSGGPKLQQSNNWVVNGTWVAGYDGVQDTNRKGTLRVSRKTPAPVQAEITVGTFQVFGGDSTMQGGQRNFW